jgi:hypothetical protein
LKICISTQTNPNDNLSVDKFSRPVANEFLIRSFNKGLAMAPRTVDNLGPEASQSYAERKEAYDATYIREAPTIPDKTRIEVTTPSFTPELDELLKLQPSGITWASIPPPRGYYQQRNRLFTSQLIPSMGSQDKQESQTQKILAKIKSMTEHKTHEEKGVRNKRQQYEQELSLEEEEKEKKILTTLLEKITSLDKLILEVNSRRGQYHKG